MPGVDPVIGPTSCINAARLYKESVLFPNSFESARVRFPGVPFRVASFRNLDVPDGSRHGVLAWYSLIHVPPDELSLVLREISRALTQGGQLLVGFFDGSPGDSFPHAVTTAYYWSPEQMGDLLSEAGFEVARHGDTPGPGQAGSCSHNCRRPVKDPLSGFTGRFVDVCESPR
ncbi:class I SAM-dependent methyltransferase [Arthrobacter sp. LjRoot78]|uniref:class I SAM-dependent methyltransferase n=1 Tax=Arthrobacter sp. LjRoot78 TaxID=3342338 RepID=UPI003ECC79BB